MPEDAGFEEFLLRFGDAEGAWALLEEAEQLADADRHKPLMAAVARGAESSAVLVRAAGLLAAAGLDREAREALEQALLLDGPTAPAQIAYARQLRAVGDLDGARGWYRGGLGRARPDMALMLDYAGLEQELGEPLSATRITAAAKSLALGSADDLIAAGRRLLSLQRPDLAGLAFAHAWRSGHRGDDLLRLIAASDDGPAGPLSSSIDAAIPGGPTIRAAAASMLAQIKLAKSPGSATSAVSAHLRETSSQWVPLDRLSAVLRERIVRREAFSWIRLGDGEARFLLHTKPDLRGELEERDVSAIVGLIWSIWFGEPFEQADPRRVRELGAALDGAIGEADLLGVTSAQRLADDQQHRGYCAALERYVQGLPPRDDRLFTDAAFNTRLHEADPFLGKLLTGLDFLGVISPHPDLAERLRRRLGIARGVSYDIPGEGRLGRERERGDRGRHFPLVYDRLMADLVVPFPGAVFLVAGGLLGKIYCSRIRALGGIALDIGALADAWMGINTRGAPLDLSLRAVLPA